MDGCWPWNCLSAVLWMAVDDFHGFRSCMVSLGILAVLGGLFGKQRGIISRSSKSGMHSGIWEQAF